MPIYRIHIKLREILGNLTPIEAKQLYMELERKIKNKTYEPSEKERIEIEKEYPFNFGLKEKISKNYSGDYLVNIAREGINFSDVDEQGKDSLIKELCQRILKMECDKKMSEITDKKCSEIFDCINGNCNNCIENPDNDYTDLLKSGNCYKPTKKQI